MQFEAEGKTSSWSPFRIGDDEIERARKGFEVSGRQDLSDRLMLPLHPIKGTINRITPRERAGLVIEGNAAFLVESLREDGAFPEAEHQLAEETIDTGLQAIHDADEMIGATSGSAGAVISTTIIAKLPLDRSVGNR